MDSTPTSAQASSRSCVPGHRIDAVMLRGSDLQGTRVAQRLEQGMERGTRSAEDHCAVVLMGRSLTGHLYRRGAANRLSQASRAQYRLSQEIAKQLPGADAATLRETVEMLVNRDAGWKRAAKSALAGLRYSSRGSVNPISAAQRLAFDAARSGRLPVCRRGRSRGRCRMLDSVEPVPGGSVSRGWGKDREPETSLP